MANSIFTAIDAMTKRNQEGVEPAKIVRYLSELQPNSIIIDADVKAVAALLRNYLERATMKQGSQNRGGQSKARKLMVQKIRFANQAVKDSWKKQRPAFLATIYQELTDADC